MKRNSMLTFLKEKSFLIVLTLTLVSAGTMALLFTLGNESRKNGSEIAQQKETNQVTPSTETTDTKEGMGQEMADASQKIQMSKIDLMEENVQNSQKLLEEAALAPELEDQYVDAELSEEVSASDVVSEEFSETEGLSLQWPVVGAVIMEFSMDHSVYFQTLAQYQYNPAMLIQAGKGTEVLCSAAGTVIDVGTTNEYGNYVTVDLGEGFALTYGQLEDVTAEVGEMLEKGERIGVVASPSRSYSLEGENLYLKLTKDGVPVNPGIYLEKQ